METVTALRQYGLFDAKVPRYTSFPPANRFLPEVGKDNQRAWLAGLPADEPVSIYVHIPFCRRLCWFCACRTQGTATLEPVQDYLTDLRAEVAELARAMPQGVRMGRLHLGGGTPTLLTPAQMNALLSDIFQAVSPSEAFEFSVEIDPTEAAPGVLAELARWNMGRASIGVQDFDPRVQQAIGRRQSFEQTEEVVTTLRDLGVESLNIDLLYGLPHQTAETLSHTLDRVASLRPDRLALYGYAHVPHMSKRQVMIPEDALPDAEKRFVVSQIAQSRLSLLGYLPLGIDHFALPHDSLAKAAAKGTMRRNFQGYTDDPCPSLIGLGASAISSFRQGYSQNAVATAAYRRRVQTDGLAGHKGFVLSPSDRLKSELIGSIMCRGRLDLDECTQRHGYDRAEVETIITELVKSFPGALRRRAGRLEILPGFEALARIVAARIDRRLSDRHIHSMAI